MRYGGTTVLVCKQSNKTRRGIEFIKRNILYFDRVIRAERELCLNGWCSQLRGFTSDHLTLAR